MISVLVDHGTSVIYFEVPAASKRLRGIWAVRLSPDTKSIATVRGDGQIKVCTRYILGVLFLLM
jgi:hypothetical protein